MTTKMTIAEALGEIEEELEFANPKRPDYSTCVQLERLTAWREAIANHTGKVCPWCRGEIHAQCESKQPSGSLYCSRKMAHDGPHVACSAAPDDGGWDDHNIARWEQG